MRGEEVGDPRASSFGEPGRHRSPHSAEYRKRQRAKLRIEGLNAYYGASHVLFDVSMDVGEGETVALIGRNGAGKTTALKSVMGMAGISKEGSIKVKGKEMVGLPTHKVAKLGRVGLVPEGRRVFGDLTVEENLLVAAKRGERGKRAGRRGQAGDQEGAWSHERVFEVFPLLEKVRRSKGAWLSGGEQQVLAIARALVGDPEVLLLDEPTEGLAPRVVETLAEQLQKIKRTGLTMLLAEQHVGLVLGLADRAYVLDRGTIRYEGSPKALLSDEAVRRAHLAL